MDSYYTWIILMVIICAVGVVATVLILVHNKANTDERMSKLCDIKYTKILSSGGGTYGSVHTYGNDGNNYGSYSTAHTTKFLVVYKNGASEIVTVHDTSRLCKEYLQRLKTTD